MTGMECGCICGIDNEPPTLFESKIVAARKQHACCECGEVVEIGQQYESVFGIWPSVNGAERFRTCLPCATIRDDYCCSFTGVRQEVWEELGVDYVTGETDGRE